MKIKADPQMQLQFTASRANFAAMEARNYHLEEVCEKMLCGRDIGQNEVSYIYVFEHFESYLIQTRNIKDTHILLFFMGLSKR